MFMRNSAGGPILARAARGVNGAAGVVARTLTKD
jgi:hypothetical protein